MTDKRRATVKDATTIWILKLMLDDERDLAWMRHAAQVEEVGILNDGELMMNFRDMKGALAAVRRIREAGVQFMYSMQSAYQRGQEKTPGPH
jgi:hypothetical protein